MTTLKPGFHPATTDIACALFLFFSIAALVSFAYADAFGWMFHSWFEYEEYSHGIMIPFVSAYLIWQRKTNLTHAVNRNWVVGISAVAMSLLFFIVMKLATVHFGVLLSFLFLAFSLTYLAIGKDNLKEILGPLAILFFMLPLPNFITNNLSSELQLISSKIGVEFIRLFDITVYLEGNVIDLGSYKLQVVDACSGLRYLFPLMSLAFILVYIASIRPWQKVVIFLSSVPITVIMNSLRIGAIGVSVEYWGPEMAEGILHDIEGWFMFMASITVMLLLMWGVLRFSGDKRSIRDSFDFSTSEKDRQNNPKVLSGIVSHLRSFNIVLFIGGTLVALMVLIEASAGASLQHQTENRLRFNHFPLFIGDWQGQPKVLEQVYIDELRFDDYVLVDYKKQEQNLNFYVAYYSQQSSGSSAHSPRSCMPGGGWQIESIEQVVLDDVFINSTPLKTNRVLIQRGEHKQVVYYWFQQRGRVITNEYLVKWYLFWDSLTKQRSDGALVRLVVPLGEGAGFDEADALVSDFMTDVQFKLPSFIPG